MESNQPVKDPYARSHEMVIYTQENNNPALYCRKCGETVYRFNSVAGLDHINDEAKQHRARARKGN